MRRITILGSTGSIGRNALEVISRHRDRFKVVALTAGSNIGLLERQIKAFQPDIVAIADEKAAETLRRRIKRRYLRLTMLSGHEGVTEVASYRDTDFVLSAIVGAAGLEPTIAAVRSGKTIGLANKETLVMAGKIVTEEARHYGAKILPVDSEHSAVFQCIEGHRRSDVRKIILTASGGPFANRKIHEFSDITPEDALKHPSWRMGKKITIDSATLMNKGLEMIEAHYLFNLPPERIEVLIHPQSIVHSIVAFTDGSCIAQLSYPDMKGPIAYTLSYPERLVDIMHELDLHRISSLTFKKPNSRCFPCLSYAYRAMEHRGTMPSVLNAANEVAVHAFLRGMIRFTDIPLVIRKTMDTHDVMSDTELNAIREADRWARRKAEEVIKSLSS